MFETVDDPVDVLVVFLGSEIRPIRLRWKGRTYRVRVTGQWKRREGMAVIRYFALEAAGGWVFEVQFDSRPAAWTLTKAWGEERPNAVTRHKPLRPN